MVAPAHVNTQTGTNTKSVTRPTGTTSDGILVLTGIVYDDATVSSGDASLSGWTLRSFVSSGGTNPTASWVWTKDASGGDAASFTWTGPTGYSETTCSRYNHAGGVPVFDVAGTATSGRATSGSIPALTTTAADCVIYAVLGSYDNGVSGTPSGFTQRANWDSVNYVWDRAVTTATTYGPTTASFSGTTTYNLHAIAIRPPSSGAADVAGTPTTSASVSDTGVVTATASVVGTATTSSSPSDTGIVTATATVVGTATTSASVSDTGVITVTATVIGTPTTSGGDSDTATVTATATVVGTATTSATGSDAADVGSTATTDVVGTPTTSATVADTATITATATVIGTPTTSGTMSATATITATATVVGTASTSATVSDTATTVIVVTVTITGELTTSNVTTRRTTTNITGERTTSHDEDSTMSAAYIRDDNYVPILTDGDVPILVDDLTPAWRLKTSNVTIERTTSSVTAARTTQEETL